MKIWLRLADPDPDQSDIDPPDPATDPHSDPPDPYPDPQLKPIRPRIRDRGQPIQGRISRFFEP